jgi:hypothetical protein
MFVVQTENIFSNRMLQKTYDHSRIIGAPKEDSALVNIISVKFPKQNFLNDFLVISISNAPH